MVMVDKIDPFICYSPFSFPLTGSLNFVGLSVWCVVGGGEGGIELQVKSR
jgi:hypothetical protein